MENPIKKDPELKINPIYQAPHIDVILSPERPYIDEKQKKIEILSEENELLKKQLVDLQKTTEDRFNTIAILLQDLQKNNKK